MRIGQSEGEPQCDLGQGAEEGDGHAIHGMVTKGAASDLADEETADDTHEHEDSSEDQSPGKRSWVYETEWMFQFLHGVPPKTASMSAWDREDYSCSSQ
jgi:hypothetical protein